MDHTPVDLASVALSDEAISTATGKHPKRHPTPFYVPSELREALAAQLAAVAPLLAAQSQANEKLEAEVKVLTDGLADMHDERCIFPKPDPDPECFACHVFHELAALSPAPPTGATEDCPELKQALEENAFHTCGYREPILVQRDHEREHGCHGTGKVGW